jgi:hypothetical protein
VNQHLDLRLKRDVDSAKGQLCFNCFCASLTFSA